MDLNRRRLLLWLGTVGLASGVTVSTGAFTRSTAKRGVEINVADVGIELIANETLASVVDVEKEDSVEIDTAEILDDMDGDGVNVASVLEIGDTDGPAGDNDDEGGEGEAFRIFNETNIDFDISFRSELSVADGGDGEDDDVSVSIFVGGNAVDSTSEEVEQVDEDGEGGDSYRLEGTSAGTAAQTLFVALEFDLDNQNPDELEGEIQILAAPVA